MLGYCPPHTDPIKLDLPAPQLDTAYSAVEYILALANVLEVMMSILPWLAALNVVPLPLDDLLCKDLDVALAS
jgi:hypothetical protein